MTDITLAVRVVRRRWWGQANRVKELREAQSEEVRLIVVIARTTYVGKSQSCMVISGRFIRSRAARGGGAAAGGEGAESSAEEAPGGEGAAAEPGAVNAARACGAHWAFAVHHTPVL